MVQEDGGREEIIIVASAREITGTMPKALESIVLDYWSYIWS